MSLISEGDSEPLLSLGVIKSSTNFLPAFSDGVSNPLSPASVMMRLKLPAKSSLTFSSGKNFVRSSYASPESLCSACMPSCPVSSTTSPTTSPVSLKAASRSSPAALRLAVLTASPINGTDVILCSAVSAMPPRACPTVGCTPASLSTPIPALFN